VTLALPVKPFVANDPLVASQDFTKLLIGISNTNELSALDLLIVDVPACSATTMMAHWPVVDPCGESSETSSPRSGKSRILADSVGLN
jgi:hypothetical protein